MSAALTDIAAERQRQIEVEGWTPEHDDAHANGELSDAAACYATPKEITFRGMDVWPWWNIWRDAAGYVTSRTKAWWKPKDRRRDLVRAGALIVAEIERLDRQSKAGAQ